MSPRDLNPILLDPNPEAAGGGAAPEPTPAPTEPKAEPKPAEATKPAETKLVQVAPDWLEAKLARAARADELEAKAAEVERQRQAERDQQLLEHQQLGKQIKELIAERDKGYGERDARIASLVDRLQSRALSEAVADALAGVSFASEHARAQAKRELAARITAQEKDGDFVAIGPTGQPAGEYLRTLIRSEEFAHFLAPQSRGGSGGTNPSPAPAGSNGRPAEGMAGLLERFQARYSQTAVTN